MGLIGDETASSFQPQKGDESLIHPFQIKSANLIILLYKSVTKVLNKNF